MAAYNVLDARNRLSRLIAEAEAGGEVVLMRRGRPVARIVSDVGEPMTARALAELLSSAPMPPRLLASEASLEERIEENREAWV